MHDLRYALRTLARNRGFTAVAVLTLALGIGANTAIFSVVNGVLLRPLPYPEPGGIVQVWTSTAADPRDSHSAGDFMDFQRRNGTLSALAGYREDAVTIAVPGGEPVRVSGAIVTAQYFDVLGVRAIEGRAFSTATESGTTEPLAVLSEGVWRQHFGSAPGLIGRRVRLNGVPHTLLGVMPDRFAYPENVRLWVLSTLPVPPPPVDVKGDLLETRDIQYFQAIARLAPGVSMQQASADLRTIADDLGQRFPQTNAGRGVSLQPLHERLVGDVRGALLVLLGAVGVVLLIACANVSSLLLARASGRQRELAIRAALGAGRGRLVRQLITESAVLAVLGGALGLLTGAWAVHLLLAVLPDGTPRAAEIGLDGTVAAAAFALACVSAVLFGLMPSLQASRADGVAALRSSERGSTGDRRRARARSTLVVAEIALTMILLVSAGLLANSFLRLQRVDPGFRPDGVMMVGLPLPQSKYPDGKRQAGFYARLLDGIREQPGIASAALLFPGPLEGRNARGSFSVEGRPAPAARAQQPQAFIASVSSGYFETLRIPLLRGRDFTERDGESAQAVAIVNSTLARRYFAGEDPVDRRVRFGETGEEWLTIVGVVSDSRNLGLDAEPAPLMYIPYRQFPLPFMGLAIRSDAGAATVAAIVRDQVRQADPDLPVDRVRPLPELLDEAVAQPRFRTWLITAFALIATLLAAVGVYGLISYSVTQRTREIGIRIALGANPDQVTGAIVREGLVLGLAGVGIGMAGAAAATRALSSLLFGIRATDPLTFGGVAALLLGIAVLASYIPSRRALRVNPLTALRTE